MVRAIASTLVVVLALLGCDRLKIENAPPPAKPSEIGRYTIIHSPQAERDTILLDTVTGKTWSRVEVTDIVGEPPAWDPMPELNTPADIAALAQVHGWKKASEHSR
jgi:hypothetical protein